MTKGLYHCTSTQLHCFRAIPVASQSPRITATHLLPEYYDFSRIQERLEMLRWWRQTTNLITMDKYSNLYY